MSKNRTIFLEDFKCPQCEGTLNFNGKEVWCSFVGDKKQNIAACDYGLAGGITLKGLVAAGEKPKSDSAACSADIIGQTLEYEPVSIAIDQHLLANIYENLQDGVEYMHNALTEHDSTLGRSTKKNRSWAETIEVDLVKAKQSISRLKSIAGDILPNKSR